MPQHSSCRSTASLRIPEIRLFIGSVGFFTLASKALAVVIGFQIYRITRSPLALGWLGLVEAIPAISIAPFGGYVADHCNRRTILLVTRAVSLACAAAMAFFSRHGQDASLAGLYSMVFLAGVARGFAEPAGTAFEAQVVPRELTLNASSWISSTWISCAVIGPAAIGFIFDARGAAFAYVLIAAAFLVSWACTGLIAPRPQPVPRRDESVWQSIAQGWKYVFRRQPLWASMGLDLFAVFFGGAIALLPVFAEEILHVGARGLGLLNAAPSLGAFLTTLAATRRPQIERAGRNLLVTIAGFGLSIIVFAFSRNFWLSLAALFMSGVFDGINMVIRRSILRLLSPDELRGRIAAANSIFICASNELGAFESGMGAAWLGAVPCVALGGAVTLGIVLLAGFFAHELRGLRFDVHTLEQTNSPT